MGIHEINIGLLTKSCLSCQPGRISQIYTGSENKIGWTLQNLFFLEKSFPCSESFPVRAQIANIEVVVSYFYLLPKHII